MTTTTAPSPPELSPTVAWSQRVRKVGGYIQLAFAAFWLTRGGLSVGGVTGAVLAVGGVLLSLVVLGYAVVDSADVGRRRTGTEAKRIEGSVTAATVTELIASFAFPVIVVAAGHSDWVLPSIAITIGPLILVAVMSGASLAATTGLGAGVILLGTAAAGFHDLASLRPGRLAASFDISPPNRA